jgi:type IV secretion system protein VirB10
VLLVWTRLIMPNGRSIVLERQPGADTQGFAGLEDEVDHHWGRLAMAAALSTVLGVGLELGATNNDSAIVTALRRGGNRQPQSDRPAGRAPQSQHPADHHDSPRLSGPRDR